MPPDPAKKQPTDAAELIARAKRDAEAEQMIARMQEDDERDERDGVDLSDSSQAGNKFTPGSGIDSAEDWDLSGRASSDHGASFGSSNTSDAGPSGEGGGSGLSLNGGGTLPERADTPSTTLNVPIDVNQTDEDTADANPSDGDATCDAPLAPRYRPERRPPMATLVICDDGLSTGEELRIRKTPFEVGRVQGDAVIPHDHQMSRRHFLIERRQKADAWEWSLKDLGSLNGVFLRRVSARIDDGDELLVAGDVVRVNHAGNSRLRLTKIGAGSTEERATIDPGVHILGADQAVCVPLLADAPLLAPRHVRLECDRVGRWIAAALPGVDGLWLRTPGFPLEDGAQWQTGEQRFIFRLP